MLRTTLQQAKLRETLEAAAVPSTGIERLLATATWHYINQRTREGWRPCRAAHG